MLTEEEEKRLNRLVEISTGLHPAIVHYEMSTIAFQWLAEKLKETNDEFKKFKEEVYKIVDKEWEAHWERNKEEDKKDYEIMHSMCTVDSECDCQNKEIPEVYKNPKNEISDRFYPR